MTPVVTSREIRERALKASASGEAQQDEAELDALAVQEAHFLGSGEALKVLRDLRWQAHQGRSSPLSILVHSRRVSHDNLRSEENCGRSPSLHSAWYLQEHCRKRGCTVTFEGRKKGSDSKAYKRTLITIWGSLLPSQAEEQLAETWQLQLAWASCRGGVRGARIVKTMWACLRTASWHGKFGVSKSFPGLSAIDQPRAGTIETLQQSLRTSDQAAAWVVSYFAARQFEIRLEDERSRQTSVVLRYPKPDSDDSGGEQTTSSPH